MFRSPETVNIFYDPRTELISNLPYKVKLKIAKNALSHPQIFNVFVNNEGTNYPSVDIYPKVQFNIPYFTYKRVFRSITILRIKSNI